MYPSKIILYLNIQLNKETNKTSSSIPRPLRCPRRERVRFPLPCHDAGSGLGMMPTPVKGGGGGEGLILFALIDTKFKQIFLLIIC
jgi:hypothetical protein